MEKTKITLEELTPLLRDIQGKTLCMSDEWVCPTDSMYEHECNSYPLTPMKSRARKVLRRAVEGNAGEITYDSNKEPESSCWIKNAIYHRVNYEVPCPRENCLDRGPSCYGSTNEPTLIGKLNWIESARE